MNNDRARGALEIFNDLKSLPQCVEVEGARLHTAKYLFPVIYLNTINGMVFGLELDEAFSAKICGSALIVGNLNATQYDINTKIDNILQMEKLLACWLSQARAYGLQDIVSEQQDG